METKINNAFSDFIVKLGHEFDWKAVALWSQQDFLLKSFNLLQISTKEVQIIYQSIKNKYTERKILDWPDEWHKNERKIFILILLCFCKDQNKHPFSMELEDWKYLSSLTFNKNHLFLKFQAFTLLKCHRKINWLSSDDKLIKDLVKTYGEGNWNEISKMMFYKTNATQYFSSKQIRQRWYNHISQNVKKGPWTEQQDIILMQHVLQKNKHWCQIVRILEKKRTEHMIKNRFKILTKKSSENYNIGNQKIILLLKQFQTKYGAQSNLKQKVSEDSNQNSLIVQKDVPKPQTTIDSFSSKMENRVKKQENKLRSHQLKTQKLNQDAQTPFLKNEIVLTEPNVEAFNGFVWPNLAHNHYVNMPNGYPFMNPQQVIYIPIPMYQNWALQNSFKCCNNFSFYQGQFGSKQDGK